METLLGNVVRRHHDKRALAIDIDPSDLGDYITTLAGFFFGEEVGFAAETIVFLLGAIFGAGDDNSEPMSSGLTEAIQKVVSYAFTSSLVTSVNAQITNAEETFAKISGAVSGMNMKPALLGGNPVWAQDASTEYVYGLYEHVIDQLTTGANPYQTLTGSQYKGAGAATYAVAASYHITALLAMVAIGQHREADLAQLKSTAANVAAGMSTLVTQIIEHATGQIEPYADGQGYNDEYCTLTYKANGAEQSVNACHNLAEGNACSICSAMSSSAPCLHAEFTQDDSYCGISQVTTCENRTLFSMGTAARNTYANATVTYLFKEFSFDPIFLADQWASLAKYGPSASTYPSTPVTGKQLAAAGVSVTQCASSCVTFGAPVNLTCSVPPDGTCADGSGCAATYTDASGKRLWACAGNPAGDTARRYAQLVNSGPLQPSWSSCAACAAQPAAGPDAEVSSVTCPGVAQDVVLYARASEARRGGGHLSASRLTANVDAFVSAVGDASSACTSSCGALMACSTAAVLPCASGDGSQSAPCAIASSEQCTADSDCGNARCVSDPSRGGRSGWCAWPWAAPPPSMRCPVGWTGGGTAANPCVKPGAFNSPATVYVGDGMVRNTCSLDASVACLDDADCSGNGTCSFGVIMGSPQSACSSEHGRACTALDLGSSPMAGEFGCSNYCSNDPSTPCTGAQDCGGHPCTQNTCDPYAGIDGLRNVAAQVEQAESSSGAAPTQSTQGGRQAYWYGVAEPVPENPVCACQDAYDACENVCILDPAIQIFNCPQQLEGLVVPDPSLRRHVYPPTSAGSVAEAMRGCLQTTKCASKRLTDCLASDGHAVIPGKYYNTVEAGTDASDYAFFNNACFSWDRPTLKHNYWQVPGYTDGCSDDVQCNKMRGCYAYAGTGQTNGCYFGTPLQNTSGDCVDSFTTCT